MRSLRSFAALLKLAPGTTSFTLALLMLLAGLTDGIGILLLLPLLETLQPAHSSGHPALQHFQHYLSDLGITPGIGFLLTLFLVLIAMRSAVQYGRDRAGAHLQYQVVDTVRLQCFRALLNAEWRWLTTTRQADHTNQLLTDVGRIGAGLQFGLGLLVSLTTMAAWLVSAGILSWRVTLLAAVSGGIVLGLLAGQRRKALHLGQHLGQANRDLHANVQESLSGMKLTKILGTEQRQLDRLTVTTGILRSQQQQFVTSTSLTRSLFQLLGATMLAVYLFAGIQVWHQPLSKLLILIMIFARMIPLFMQAMQQFHHWLNALPALDSTLHLLRECQLHAEPEDSGDTTPWPITRELRLDKIEVHYANRPQPVLNQVSVCFPARTTTAIMGPSGAGKSTLADVVMGLLEPDQGQVSVDGVPIAGHQRRRWRHSVAYVPQEVFLFNDSIRNNLLWGHAGADDTALRQALTQAAASFVFELPMGLDTIVGDNGVRLSGGERQRLALARALLRQPSLLILDEATSALDRENEARIRSAIENLHGNLTVILIGHRLPTLEHADQVLLLDQGTLTYQGKWNGISTPPTPLPTTAKPVN